MIIINKEIVYIYNVKYITTNVISYYRFNFVQNLNSKDHL